MICTECGDDGLERSAFWGWRVVVLAREVSIVTISHVPFINKATNRNFRTLVYPDDTGPRIGTDYST